MNIVKLTNVEVVEDARLTPEKTRADGSKVDARLWLRVKESETDGGWFNVWPLVIWGALAVNLATLLKKGARIAHVICTCKVTAEKDDAGKWSQYIELRPVRDNTGAYRKDAIGAIEQPAPAPQAAPAASVDQLAALVAALGPNGMATLAKLIGQVAPAAVAEPPAADLGGEITTEDDCPFA